MKKTIALILCSALILCGLCSCGMPSSLDEVEDFSFSLVWGRHGVSLYDSLTGKLVKDKNARPVEDYTTELILSDDQQKEVYSIIRDLDPVRYPDDYSRGVGMSDSYVTIILTVRYDDVEKTITCKNVCLDYYRSGSEVRFMTAIDKLIALILSTTEWQDLPENPLLYD